jgi:hypothetical protein
MRKTCSENGCDAPKSLCKHLMSFDYQDCPHWNQTKVEKETVKTNSSIGNKVIPWSGMELTPADISLLSHRSTPLIIGVVGAANAGKTSYLGMLYTLLFNGRKFQQWNFAGSYTLIAWEAQAKGLKIGVNGKVAFPKATPSAPDYYSFYHLALKKQKQLYDVLFADSSGEVFTKWAADTEDAEADNAKWIYQNSDALLFFVDSESLIEGRGRVRNKIAQLATQIAAGLDARPMVIVWSKADKLDQISPTIRQAVEDNLTDNFPDAPVYYISNFSKDAQDKLCYINNLAATEAVLDGLTLIQSVSISPMLPTSKDFFFNYHGKHESK